MLLFHLRPVKAQLSVEHIQACLQFLQFVRVLERLTQFFGVVRELLLALRKLRFRKFQAVRQLSEGVVDARDIPQCVVAEFDLGFRTAFALETQHVRLRAA